MHTKSQSSNDASSWRLYMTKIQQYSFSETWCSDEMKQNQIEAFTTITISTCDLFLRLGEEHR